MSLPTVSAESQFPILPPAGVPLHAVDLLIQLGVGAVLGVAITWHFRRFASTFANRVEFGRVIPFILLTTILIIAVVKSSIALSLGLVGALSIVRFRTPIKEPEELAYLFLALATGVGLGAAQTVSTLVAVPTVLLLMSGLRLSERRGAPRNLYLTIDTAAAGAAPDVAGLEGIVRRHTRASDLRRFDLREESLEASFWIDVDGTEQLHALGAELRATYPGIGVCFLDQSRTPGA